MLKRRGLADLLTRILSAIVLMAAALASVWQGGLVFDLVWLCAALAVGCEWQNLIAARYPRLRIFLAILGLVLGAFFLGKAWLGTACTIVGTCGLAAALAADPGRRIWALGGIVYAGLLLFALGALHGSEGYGVRSIVWLFAIVWGTDVFAYFGGRLIGGAKLWPNVSPSKTWSGTLIGVFSGAILGMAAGGYGLVFPAQAPLFILSLSIAAISQAGDMFESWVKRRFGAKDASGLIPGHGGFMDRLDGFIAAAAFAALVGAARGGTSVAAGLFEWR
ncbi:MAG: phosphatidate cytidylyltransferase [Beijerinckiaceae bacterium]|nr:phosphatidate cytidylyltransferase [Beijerinckiaceae bacterium]